MAKSIPPLSATAVKNLTYPHTEKEGKPKNPVLTAVGGVPGLHIQVTAAEAKSWLYRYRIGAKRRTMGLGSYDHRGRAGLTLEQARDKAGDLRTLVREGTDPLEAKAAAKANLVIEQSVPTFAECIDEWEKEHPMKAGDSPKHRKNWLNSVRAIEPLQSIQVNALTDRDVWRAFEPIAARTTNAKKVLGRVAAVMRWAAGEEYYKGPNPADTEWINSKFKAKAKTKKVTHHPAVQIDEAAEWFEAVRARDEISSRALEFLALTAVRSGQVRSATWDEIDLDKGIWTSKEENVKDGREHAIPLSNAAIELLQGLPRLNERVFPGTAKDGRMSENAITNAMNALHKATDNKFVDRKSGLPAKPHGLRSTFKDWAIERTRFPNDMSEIALGHNVGNSVTRAYQRTDMVEKRRALMQAWDDHLNGIVESAEVIKIHG